MGRGSLRRLIRIDSAVGNAHFSMRGKAKNNSIRLNWVFECVQKKLKELLVLRSMLSVRRLAKVVR